MTLLTTAFAQGTHAARPAAAASNAGFYYFETDTTNLFQSTGSAWQQIASTGGGGGGGFTEKDYVQITADASFTGGSGAQTTILTGNSKSYSGSQTVMVNVYSPGVSNSSGAATIIELFRDSTDLGRMLQVNGSAASSGSLVSYRDTPAAGNHTYTVKGWVSGGTGTFLASAPFLPGFLQVVALN